MFVLANADGAFLVLMIFFIMTTIGFVGMSACKAYEEKCRKEREKTEMEAWRSIQPNARRD